MRKLELNEMGAFVAVAEHASFVKAATDLGMPRSSLSETIRRLEEKLSVRLFNRTTRSVAVTDVGARLLAQIRPLLDSFDAIVESTNDFRDKPAGQLRLTVPRSAVRMVIEPMLARFLATYSEIRLEISVDNALTDIVRGRFDAGIRLGHRVERDMIAVRLAETRAVIVASPDYLARHSQLKTPGDLRAHNCIHRRFPSGALHDRWAFQKRGKRFEVAVDGTLIVDDADLAVRAALDGAGIAYVLANFSAPFVAEGRLLPLLDSWPPAPVEFYLYYPSRRQSPAPLQALVDFLRAELPNGRRGEREAPSTP
jgi:DNA-binding transcriptional LysR family regulator